MIFIETLPFLLLMFRTNILIPSTSTVISGWGLHFHGGHPVNVFTLLENNILCHSTTSLLLLNRTVGIKSSNFSKSMSNVHARLNEHSFIKSLQYVGIKHLFIQIVQYSKTFFVF